MDACEISNKMFRALRNSQGVEGVIMRSLDRYDVATRDEVCLKMLGMKDCSSRISFSISRYRDSYSKYSFSFEHNVPVDTLITFFKEKKKGVVTAAVKQIKDRFHGLDYECQKEIISMFLDSSVSYRKWALKTMIQWDEPLFYNKVIDLWRKYKEEESLEVIITKVSGEALRNVYDEVLPYLNDFNYSRFVRCHGMEDWLAVDTERLYKMSPITSTFMKTMSMTRQGLSKEQCGRVLYGFLQRFLTDEYIEKYFDTFKIYRDMYGNCPPLAYDFTNFKLMANHPVSGDSREIHIRYFLEPMAKMGHYDLVAGIVNWGNGVNKLLSLPEKMFHAKYGEEIGEEYQRLCKKRIQDYLRLLRDTMPLNFKGVEDTPLCNLSEFYYEQSLDSLSKHIGDWNDMLMPF